MTVYTQLSQAEDHTTDCLNMVEPPVVVFVEPAHVHWVFLAFSDSQTPFSGFTPGFKC